MTVLTDADKARIAEYRHSTPEAIRDAVAQYAGITLDELAGRNQRAAGLRAIVCDVAYRHGSSDSDIAAVLGISRESVRELRKRAIERAEGRA